MANWYVDSTSGAGGDGTTWALAYDKISDALAAAGTVAGDTVWVSHTHAESTATTLTWTDIKGTFADPVRIICANKAGSVPPVEADLRTTAVVTVTGTGVFTVNNTANRCFYIYGITFDIGSGAATGTITLGTPGACTQSFENCAFRIIGTTGGSISLGAALTNQFYLKNCTMQFGNVSSPFFAVSSFIWDGGSITGSVFPTNFFTTSGISNQSLRLFRNFDWSNLGSGKTLWGPGNTRATITFENCKLNAAVTLMTSRATTPNGGKLVLIRSDSAETGYRTAIVGDYAGDLTTSVTVVRSGGASDSVTPISWKLESSANSEWMNPFEALPLWKFNDTIDEAIDITIEGVGDPRTGMFSALPTDKEFWIEVSYQGTSGSSLGLTTGSATVLATGAAHTASTAAWDSMATARANSTAYVLGDVVKVASNAGRIFICTTAGTTAGSEPGGYASAVDGGSVTDNTATFKAGWRFNITISVTPTCVGAIQVVPKLAKVSSVIYLDPSLAPVVEAFGGFIDDDGHTSFIDDDGNTTFTDEDGRVE